MTTESTSEITPESRAINQIYQGKLVDCSKEDWPTVRSALQRKAASWIDGGDTLRAMIALEEVRRLDGVFA